MKTSRLPLLVLSCLLATLAVPARGALSHLAVADSGELLRLRAGAYGDLFPDGDGAAAAAPVLALEIESAGGLERLLVPGTENGRVEANPVVIYESGLGRAILLWKSAAANGTFRIDFATLADAPGDRRLEALGAVGAESSGPVKTPFVAFTRDAYELDLGPDESFSTRRTVVHLAWRPKGEPEALRYAALAFRDGLYAGRYEVADLGRLLGADAEPGGSLPHDLEGVSDLVAAERSVMVSLADGASARVGTVEIATRPLRLSLLGELVRDEVVAATDHFDPEAIEAWADIIHGGIVIIGHRLELHPAVSDFVAREIGAWLEATAAAIDPDEIESLGEDAGRLAVHLAGARMSPDDGDPSTPPESEVLEIGKLGDEPGGVRLEQVLELRIRSDRPAPPEVEGAARIFASRDGEDLLVAWEAEGGSLRYVESRRASGGGWSEPQSLAVSEKLSAEKAYELLAEKIR